MRFANSGTKMPQHQPIAHDGFHLAKPAFSEHSNVDYLINKFKRTRTFPSLPKLIHDPPSSSRPRYDKTPRSRESNGDFVANIDCLLHDGSLLQELARSLASDSCSIFSCLSTWYETEAVWFWAFEAMFIYIYICILYTYLCLKKSGPQTLVVSRGTSNSKKSIL